VVDNKKVLFEIGTKHAIRVELFYYLQDGSKPYLRAFLFKFDSGGKKSEHQYVGELPLDSDIKEILGDITWLGAYVGSPVRNLEVVVGEGKVFTIK
jgi:hypothetical protein